MFLVPTQQQPHTFVDHRASLHSSPSTNNTYHSKLGSEVTVDALLSSPISMERSAPEYSQSGLPSPYPSNFGDTNSEGSTADHASAAQYPVKQEANYSTSGTPTSEYGVYPQSARSGSFPEHIQRSYHPASTPSSGGGMAQQQNSPSMPQQDGRNHQAHAVKSDNDVPIDPSIAAPSPTYASYGQQSPYAPAPDMTHSYSHPSSGMYAQPRPDWTGYGHHGGAPLTPGHPVYAQNPASAPPPARPNQVYSFVPIPGAQQHKRPRRRYEEIERMYKCGWNGCEKAYGTLNHLNAHVTMQSHGQKRTPEEFKEIRKEWKQRKKEEEAARKAEEERQRVAAAASVQNGGPDPQGPDGTPTSSYPGSRPVQLPPIGYQPAQYPPPPTASVPQQPLPDYNNHMYSNYQPHSPYAQPSQGISYQSNGGQPPSH